MNKKYDLIKLLLCAFMVLLPSIVGAQVLIKGTVVDEKNETLIGVTVRLKSDATKGTVTDVDGKFTISVPNKSAVLVFSYMGYVSQELKAVADKPMNILLIEDSKYLDEIVVVGYQDVRRRDLTGSVGKANIEDMLKAPVPNFDQALAGRLAGVQVSSSEGIPGGTMNIVIRGANSVTQDNSPLYVIDGFPVEDPAVGASINPNDIESIDVLKDASATAIYGARGANGVVMITTKKGKVGALNISYDFNGGVQWLSNKIEMMDAYEFVKLQAEMYPTEMTGATLGYYQTYNGKAYTLEDYRNAEQYDWQDMIFRDAWQQSHNLSLSGGTTEARYNASLSYYDQDGIVLRSNYNKIQGRLGLNLRKGKINSNFTVNYNKSTQTGASPSQTEYSGMNNLFYSVWGYRPVTQPSVALSSLMDNIQDPSVETLNDYRFNPIMSLQNDYRKYFITNIQLNGFVEYEIAKGLRFKVTGTLSNDNRRSETFNNSKTRYGYPGSTSGVNASLMTSEKVTWLNENTLSYNKTFDKKHILKLVGGISLQESQLKYNTTSNNQLMFESLGMAGIMSGAGSPTITSSFTEESMMSYFGRADYNYKSKYYLTATMRADGSSKFSEDNRWGYFPSGSTAWTFSEEPFFAPIKSIVNDGKFRAGWGKTGNNRVGAYDRFALLERLIGASGSYTTPEGLAHGVYPSNSDVNSVGVVPINLGNPNLKWETTTQANIGLDLSFLNERITFTTDWYNKVTSDLLLAVQLPLSSGYGTTKRNIGEVRNRGIEFTLNTENVKTRHFRWTSNFNIAFNKNKVLSLAEGYESYTSAATFDQNFNSQSSYIAKVGYPIGMMYGYIYDGVYGVDDFNLVGSDYVLKSTVPHFAGENNTQPGYPKYRDLNGDGLINGDDRTIIGKGDPVHIGGFTNNFTYKDFDLSVFLQWSYGNDVMNANKLMFENSFNRKKNLNQFASYANRWTFDNQSSDIPVASASESNKVFSSRIIEDGSFLRLKTVSLGYNLPQKVLRGTFISRARCYVSAQNLYTWTNYSGYDPEVSIKNTAINPGLDFSAYPRAASFTMGVNLSF